MANGKDLTERQGLLQAAILLRVGDTLEAVRDKLGGLGSFDSADLAPADMAKKAVAVGTNKSGLNTLSTILLGMMAGIFIGLGAMLCTVVTTSTGLGFGVTKLLGGLVFCLGLILVVVAGAELFTGNTLIWMSCMSGKSTWARMARNWGLVYASNLAGALLLVVIMYYTKQWSLSGNAVGANALAIANAKMDLSWTQELTRGIMCNMLVCLAVWLCFSAKTVSGKIVAIIFPITAFVAAGFEHSVANMYFLPIGVWLSHQDAVVTASGLSAANLANVDFMGVVGNLIPVTIGNIIGGSLMVGMVYWYSYLRPGCAAKAAASQAAAKPVVTTIATAAPARAEADTALLTVGSKGLYEVLSRARDDNKFLAKLAENPQEALATYSLTPKEQAALASGDIKWIESQIGRLDEAMQTWLLARLQQEKW